MIKIHSLKRIDYKEAWQLQASLFDEMLQQKLQKKENTHQGHLVLCEHPPVFTLGKNGKRSNLLVSEETLKQENIQVYHTDRGGDITYHGEGQLVVYPILDLEQLGIGLRQYVHLLEETVILLLSEIGIKAGRVQGASGVWVGEDKKICAIGIRASRGITMHGLALNVHTYLPHFDYIIACGLEGKKTTSIAQETQKDQDLSIIASLFEEIFLQKFAIADFYSKG